MTENNENKSLSPEEAKIKFDATIERMKKKLDLIHATILTTNALLKNVSNND